MYSESEEADLLRMKREEESLRTLSHDNILKLYGSLLVPDGLAGKRLFLVMEACKGNLAELCHPNLRRQLSQWDVRRIVSQILHGLEFMHTNNILHTVGNKSEILYTSKKRKRIN